MADRCFDTSSPIDAMFGKIGGSSLRSKIGKTLLGKHRCPVQASETARETKSSFPAQLCVIPSFFCNLSCHPVACRPMGDGEFDQASLPYIMDLKKVIRTSAVGEYPPRWFIRIFPDIAFDIAG